MVTQLPPKKRGHSPQFLAHVYCGQMTGCIRIPLGTKVSLGRGNIVLDGDPVPPKRGIAQFSVHVYCGQTAGWIKMPLRTEVCLGPGDIVLDGAQLLPPQKKGARPHFRPMSIVTKRSSISATGELLFYIIVAMWLNTKLRISDKLLCC